MRNKDVQKKLARTSLKGARTLAKRQNELVQLPKVPQDAQNNGVWTSLFHRISRDKMHWGSSLY